MFNTQGLTNTEKYLLAYIEEHLEEIPSISIVKLSQDANVSTASIVRTMKKLGKRSCKYENTSDNHPGKRQWQNNLEEAF